MQVAEKLLVKPVNHLLRPLLFMYKEDEAEEEDAMRYKMITNYLKVDEIKL